VTGRDDQRFLADLRAGRPEACAELVRTHYQAVYRFLAHLTRDVHAAEDLTQETFAAAWQRLGSFEGRATLATWLHRIAYTKFVDAQRAVCRHAESMKQTALMNAPSSDPFEAVAADDEARRLYRALEELNPQERTLLVLHYLQGLSYREMATVLDEPAGTVKWRTREALGRLRAVLGEEVTENATGTTSKR